MKEKNYISCFERKFTALVELHKSWHSLIGKLWQLLGTTCLQILAGCFLGLSLQDSCQSTHLCPDLSVSPCHPITVSVEHDKIEFICAVSLHVGNGTPNRGTMMSAMITPKILDIPLCVQLPQLSLALPFT